MSIVPVYKSDIIFVISIGLSLLLYLTSVAYDTQIVLTNQIDVMAFHAESTSGSWQEQSQNVYQIIQLEFLHQLWLCALNFASLTRKSKKIKSQYRRLFFLKTFDQKLCVLTHENIQSFHDKRIFNAGFNRVSKPSDSQVLLNSKWINEQMDDDRYLKWCKEYLGQRQEFWVGNIFLTLHSIILLQLALIWFRMVFIATMVFCVNSQDPYVRVSS